MGSGHILCVLFDVLVRIYEDYGYTAREAAVKIVENNLWGLDIDERAAQLSYFAVMMKARQYDRRFFTRKVQPHVYAIEESNGITSAPMHDMGLYLTQEEYAEAVKQAMRLVEEMHDAKEYGSIIHVTPCDWDLLRRFAAPREEEGQLHLDIYGEIEASARLQVLINLGETLAQNYHAVVTNPPYMGSGNMTKKLSSFLKKHYNDTKMDLSTVFMEKCMKMCKENGAISMINIPVWMFILSYENLRKDILENRTLSSMLHFGRGVFGSDFGTTAFVIFNKAMPEYTGYYQKLFSRQGAVDSLSEKFNWFFEKKDLFFAKQKSFMEIPGYPIAYSSSKSFRSNFARFSSLQEQCDVKNGLGTMDNDRFLRFWYEIEVGRITFDALSRDDFLNKKGKWAPYNKGGSARKWYGNRELVVNWENDGAEIRELAKNATGGRIVSVEFYFHESISWSYISQGKFAVRYFPTGTMFDSIGTSCFPHDKEKLYGYLGVLNTKVVTSYLNILAPTLAFNPGSVGKTPIIVDGVPDHTDSIVKDCIWLSKSDWNSFETSWDFQLHPLIRSVSTVAEAFGQWERACDERFYQLKANEEELNRIFIDIYGLQDELTPEVEDKDVTVRRADLQREIKSLISYAVGCMFGRYSLDVEGLAYAGGEWDASKYTTFQPDTDAIIPICDDEYFEDDIVGRFVKFIEVLYGKATLEVNLRFIADALGGKGSSRDVIRSYFLNDFYKDHCKTYQKRPIYWLFDSGKKNGFKCLIYMHRYQPDTIARIRTDYVHEQQSRYRTAIADLEQRINGASTSERVKLSKQLARLQAQTEEIRVYEEKIHHLADQMIKIDLDDGVKHNYEIFKDVLAKIK